MSGQGVPVLVVDDDSVFLRVVHAIAEGDDGPTFAISTVQSGSEALAVLDRRPPFTDAVRPAFIVLDFFLPDTNAPGVIAELRARDDLGAIPVLVLSEADWEEDQREAKAAGATEFQIKPSSVEALREIVVAFWKGYVHGPLSLIGRG